jgi:hypothetical protein
VQAIGSSLYDPFNRLSTMPFVRQRNIRQLVMYLAASLATQATDYQRQYRAACVYHLAFAAPDCKKSAAAHWAYNTFIADNTKFPDLSSSRR